jgi:ERCC4-type nuclease
MSVLRIIIDTREQNPLAFPEHLATTRRGTLQTGDYALECDFGFAIERKSLDDYVATVTGAESWPRFQRELYRMTEAGFPTRVVVVEGSQADILAHAYASPKVQPPFVFKRTAELLLAGVVVHFADDADLAAGYVYMLLRERANWLAQTTANKQLAQATEKETADAR